MKATLVSILLGAGIGILNTIFFKKKGFRTIGNIIAGAIGAFTGYWFISRSGIIILSGFIASVLVSILGAITVLAIVNFLFEPRSNDFE